MLISKRECYIHALVKNFNDLWHSIIDAGFFSGIGDPAVLLQDSGRLIEFYNRFGRCFDEKIKTLLLNQLPGYTHRVYDSGFIFPEKLKNIDIERI